ncbi:MAG: flavin reductase family protein [Acidimicrobiales bacterium]
MSDLVGPFPDGADPDAFDRLRRRVLWSFPTGLFVVGSAAEIDGEQRHNLMVANLVVQVATGPKLVAVAIEKGALTARLVAQGACFAVSVLRREDRAVVRRFVKPVGDITLDAAGHPVQMAGEAVVVATTGAPMLARAHAWVDCRLHSSLDLESHLLAIGEVVNAGGLEEEGVGVLRMEDTKMNYGG